VRFWQLFKKNTGIFFVIFVLAMLFAIPMRTYLVMFDTDAVTGFYTSTSVIVPALNILLAVATFIMLVPFFFSYLRKVEFIHQRSIPRALLCYTISASFFLESGHQFYITMISRGDAGSFLICIAGFFSAIFFFMFAGAALSKKAIQFPIAALFPAFWAVVHLIVSFMHYTTIVNISEYLYDMLKMVFVMVFLYYHARYAGGVSNKRELNGMLAFGLPAVLFSAVSVFPRLIASISGRNTLTLDMFDDVTYLLIAFYIVLVLAELLLSRHFTQLAIKKEEVKEA
jgi:hypothetical protein